MAQSDTRTRIKPAEDLKEPPMYRVVYLNDNQTTYEFVVESLMQYFDYTVETAQTITADIHDAGSACVAVLPYEIAEQKGIEVTMLARAQSYPLQIRVEPEGVV
ncbi:ATP-dependent Clp protease adaptor ClpS [Haliscomenobacter sp.]|jgi:ATP-dependent Clp protease adaptor protein ClpS|uniref:ATP-dependent Clp protease adaptor ClpS n=1 Tax=Haliscomenobacter sp. TaxID=2717303 RepID=UPI00336505A4